MYRSGLLTRYVAREFLLSVLVSFLFFFSIFFINVLLVTATDIMAKQVPLGDVALLVLYSLPQIIHLAFPFATLLGALMALGRLRADRELIALQASGIRLLRGMAPVMLLGGVFSGLSFATNDVLLPAGTIEFNRIYRRILYSNPGLELEPNTVKHFEDSSIVTGDVSGDVLSDVTIIDRDDSGRQRVITAAHVRLRESGQQAGVISLQLSNVFTHLIGAAPGDFEYVRAAAMEYHIVLPEIVEALVQIGPAEQSSADVWQAISVQRAQRALRQLQNEAESTHALLLDIGAVAARLADTPPTARSALLRRERQRLSAEHHRLIAASEPEPDRDLRNHLFEFHKKLAVPAACLVFALFAVPAGLLAPRSGRAYGLLVGMIMAALYWSLLVSAHSGGLRHQFTPALAIWAPNLVVLALSGVLYVLWRWRCGYSA